MDRKQEVLRQLREADGYVSGQQLCGTLGVSRTAVWKIINRLKEDGYPIEAVTNKGYRLLFRPLGQRIPAGDTGGDLQADDR